MNQPGILAALCALLMPVAGCGDGGPPLLSVSGTVTFDGVPLEAGQLTFRPVDPRAKPRVATVQRGHYEVRLPAGRMIVEAHAVRAAPALVTQDMGSGPQEMVPARYRGPDSVLQIEVLEAGDNRFPFVLESAVPRVPGPSP